jgi:TPR repeat protein
VSFSDATPVKPKKKGGGTVIVIILILVALAAGAYFFLNKPKTPDTAVEQTVKSPEVTSAPVAAPVDTPSPKEAPAAKPKTMAEKAKAQQETKNAAEEAARTAAPVVSDAPGAADLAKGMEAYKAGDFKAAHDFFKAAGNAGNAEACYQLGMMLSTGKGSVAKNTLQSKVWLKKAANLGHAAAKAAI